MKDEAQGQGHRSFSVVDVFCGAGGLSEGFRQAGFDVVLGLDWDEHACATHATNFPESITWNRDVREVTGREILRATRRRSIDVVIGGPNCQGVSERGHRDPKDARNQMFGQFARLVEELRPKFFVIENVAGLTHKHNFPLLQRVFRKFRALGYRCAADVLLAANYGVPQLRHRLVIVGTRLPRVELSLPAPSHDEHGVGAMGESRLRHVTVREAIGDLHRLSTGKGMEERDYPSVKSRLTAFQSSMRRGSVCLHNHIAAKTAQINIERVSWIPEGGNWKDIPSELLPPRFLRCRLTDHSTTYGRLRWDHPAFTITALCDNVTAGAYTHPSQDRALTVREAARLQGFPDRYRFVGAQKTRQVGNSVPPPLARHIAAHVMRLLLKRGSVPHGAIVPRLTDDFVLSVRNPNEIPILTPRYSSLFGTATRWPKGWGAEPEGWREALKNDWRLHEGMLRKRAG